MSSARDESYSQRLERWFGFVGLRQDPFASYRAESEEQVLSSLFVDRAYLYDVLGNPAFPQAAFLMAGRGCGKSATRSMVDYECRHGRFQGRVLIVPYNDFGPLLDLAQKDLSAITIRHHVRTILRFSLGAIVKHASPERLESLKGQNRRVLATFAREFFDPATRSEDPLAVGNKAATWDWAGLSPKEILERFCQLVSALGWDSVYILVDQVDETSTTAGSAARSVDLLQPLVEEPTLLAMSHLAFKFFLPLEVGAELQDRVPIRQDRVCWTTISWNGAQLEEMLRLRLRYHSEDAVTRFEDLCAPEARYRVTERLILECERSPRTLIRLCRAVVQAHIGRTATSELLSRSDITTGIHRLKHQLELERQSSGPVHDAHLPHTDDAPPPMEGLYLDPHDHVWIDGEQMHPPPSRLEMRLLKKLYYEAPNVVGHEELIKAVWEDEPIPWNVESESPQYQDEVNLRKLVARLRDRLEDQASGAGRFIHNRRGLGYYLRTK